MEASLPISEPDRKRLVRLLERTLGRGFRMAIVETPNVLTRARILSELQASFQKSEAQVVDIDIPELVDEQGTNDHGQLNIWESLKERIPPESLNSRALLILHGFETLIYKTRDRESEPVLLRQMNVQRDLFVRDFPVWWLLFIHPVSAHQLRVVAPDFCDYVSLWIRASEVQRTKQWHVGPSGTLPIMPFPAPGSSNELHEELARALHSVNDGKLDAAKDSIYSYRAKAKGVGLSMENAVADLLEARVKFLEGQTESAMRIVTDKVIPDFDGFAQSRQKAQLAFIIAWILFVSGSGSSAEEWIRKAADIYKCSGSSEELAGTYSLLGKMLRSKGELDRAEETLQNALILFRSMGKHQDTAACFLEMGLIADSRGRQGKAMSYCEKALTIYEQFGDRQGLMETHGVMGKLVEKENALDSAKNHLSEALNIARSIGSQVAEAYYLEQLGYVAEKQGDFKRSHHSYSEALTISEKMGDKYRAAVCCLGLGNVAEKMQDYVAAEKWYTKVLELNMSLKNRILEAHTYDSLGSLAERRGDFPFAEDCYRKALGIYVYSEDRSSLTTMYGNLGRISEFQGRLDAAEEWYREQIRIAKHLGNHSDLVIPFFQLGHILQQKGNSDCAEHCYNKALEASKNSRDKSFQALISAQLGALFEEMDKEQNALESYIKCASLFESVPSAYTAFGINRLKALGKETGTYQLESFWSMVTGKKMPAKIREILGCP